MRNHGKGLGISINEPNRKQMDMIELRLREWSRWVRDRQKQGHCLSIEFRYRRHSRPDDTPTGYGDWTETPPVVPEGPINALQALEVERTMRHLPDGHREALRLAYVSRMPRKMICLYLVIAYADYDRYLGDARNMVWNLLQKRSKCATIHPQAIPAPDGAR